MKKVLALLVLAACSHPVSPPPRVTFPTSISASLCSSGGYQLAAGWQVPFGDWQALFFSRNSGTKDTSAVGPQPVKTSIGCKFQAGETVFAILKGVTVPADNDETQAIVLGGSK